MATDKITTDEVCDTPELQKTKAKVMKTQRVNSLFFSISDTFKFLAGVGTAIGMALFVPHAGAFFGALVSGSGFAGALAAASTTTVAGIATATMAPIGLALIGAAALFTGVAIVSSYISQRAYQSGNYDALEVNAKHTAKNIVKELKGAVVEMHNDYQGQVHEQNQRADGKAWTQVVRPQSQAQEVPQLPNH